MIDTATSQRHAYEYRGLRMAARYDGTYSCIYEAIDL
jgi:hypothetical protein